MCLVIIARLFCLRYLPKDSARNSRTGIFSKSLTRPIKIGCYWRMKFNWLIKGKPVQTSSTVNQIVWFIRMFSQFIKFLIRFQKFDNDSSTFPYRWWFKSRRVRLLRKLTNRNIKIKIVVNQNNISSSL